MTPNTKSPSIVFDEQLCFSRQGSSLDRCFRNLSSIKLFLTSSDQERVIHALLPTRLDDRDSTRDLPVTISHSQLVLNAVAQLLTKSKKQDHVTPFLHPYTCSPFNSGATSKYFWLFANLYMVFPKYISQDISHLTAPTDSLDTLRRSDTGLFL